jgi:uncharacterized protein
MKFQPDTIDGVNVVTRREPAGVWIGSTRYGHSVLVPWIGAVLPWGPATHAELSAAHFECILALRPEVVIFGSGARLRFPPAAMLRALIERRIGVETMDTPAACRTYNVLAGERRAVVGAFLIAPAQTPLSKQDGRGPDDFIMPS